MVNYLAPDTHAGFFTVIGPGTYSTSRLRSDVTRMVLYFIPHAGKMQYHTQTIHGVVFQVESGLGLYNGNDLLKVIMLATSRRQSSYYIGAEVDQHDSTTAMRTAEVQALINSITIQ